MVNIYVGNLPFSTTDSDLQDLFSQYGAIQRVSIIQDRETGRSRGWPASQVASIGNFACRIVSWAAPTRSSPCGGAPPRGSLMAPCPG